MTDEVKKIYGTHETHNNTHYESSLSRRPVRHALPSKDVVDFSDEVRYHSVSGFLTSRHFYAIFDEEFSRSERFASPFSLIMVKVADFDAINDSCGHTDAHRLLTEFGELIHGHIRKTDHGFHLNVDEFLILMPNTGREGALAVLDKLRRDFDRFFFATSAGKSVPVRALIGLASYPVDGRTHELLLKKAAETA